MTELVLKEEVYEIVGAAMEVYYRLGRGFLEPIYQEALQIELSRRCIPLEAQRTHDLLQRVHAGEEIHSRFRLTSTRSLQSLRCVDVCRVVK